MMARVDRHPDGLGMCVWLVGTRIDGFEMPHEDAEKKGFSRVAQIVKDSTKKRK